MAEPEIEGTDISLRAALAAQFPGKSPDEVADALIEGAARQAAGAATAGDHVHQGRDLGRAGGRPRYAGRTAAGG